MNALFRILSSTVCMLLALPGCGILERSRPVNVLVRDAETKEPIPCATVSFSNLVMLWGHRGSLGFTGPDGVARMTAPRGTYLWYPLAKGYFSDVANVIPVRKGLDSKMDNQTDFIVELYSEPLATVELTVPTGYRGIIKTEFQRDDQNTHPGQRSFGFDVPQSGIVQIIGPNLLTSVTNFKARFADGTPLDLQLDPRAIGFRWLTSTGQGEMFFVVGNQEDFDDAERLFQHKDAKGNVTTDLAAMAAWTERHRQVKE